MHLSEVLGKQFNRVVHAKNILGAVVEVAQLPGRDSTHLLCRFALAFPVVFASDEGCSAGWEVADATCWP